MIVLTALFLLSLVSGCTEKSAGMAGLSLAAPAKKQADHQVVIMLGREYGSHPAILDAVIDEYGLAATGGLVYRMLYPDSFTVNKKISLTLLSDAAALANTSTVITVGAPEGTVREIAKIRRNHPDMQIITLFPSDDLISVEAVSSLVIDSTSAGDLLADEKTEILPDAELCTLLLASVVFGEKNEPAVPPLTRLNAALETAKKIQKTAKTGPVWKFSSYIDNETNLRSWNHVVVGNVSGGVE